MYRRHAGFTLIELMIVVAIIAIILSMAIPSLQSSRIAAAEASGVAGLRSLHTEVGLYRARFGYWPADFAALQAAGYARSFAIDARSLYAKSAGKPRLGAFLAFTLPRKRAYAYAYALGDPLGLGGSWSIVAAGPNPDYRSFAINEAGRLFVVVGDESSPFDS
jgi:prepilin-type N-terminal cleavage/methylation domain-containing protein